MFLVPGKRSQKRKFSTRKLVFKICLNGMQIIEQSLILNCRVAGHSDYFSFTEFKELKNTSKIVHQFDIQAMVSGLHRHLLDTAFRESSF